MGFCCCLFCVLGCLSTLWCVLWEFGPACQPLLPKEPESATCLPLLLLQIPLYRSCDVDRAQSDTRAGAWFQVWDMWQFVLYTPAACATHAIRSPTWHEPGAHLHLRPMWQTIPLPLTLWPPSHHSFRYIFWWVLITINCWYLHCGPYTITEPYSESIRIFREYFFKYFCRKLKVWTKV